MELIEKWRERRDAARRQEMTEQARSRIRVADFDGSLFIAFDGTPLVPVEESWTQREIMQQLELLRGNYIKSKV